MKQTKTVPHSLNTVKRLNMLGALLTMRAGTQLQFYMEYLVPDWTKIFPTWTTKNTVRKVIAYLEVKM